MYLDDLKIGMEIELAPVTITKERMLDFARIYDPLPLHSDEEYAKTAGIENIEEYLLGKVREANKGEKSYREISALHIRTTPFPKTTTGKIKRNNIRY